MKNWIRQNRGFLVLLLLFGLFRTAIADWNPIPSGSMRPNLLEGDVVFVNRLAYNVKVPLTDTVLARTADPKRGDVVTFSSPLDGVRLIKRLVALPGDAVEMRAKVLIINGQAARYEALDTVLEPAGPVGVLVATHVKETTAQGQHEIQWLAGVTAKDNWGPMTIPPDQFLMLGDNRDNSADSRYIGLVPRQLLIGRAERILVSADILEKWRPRFERFGRSLY
jgi:signal peptidase I